jgi:hypothetical protein
MAFTMRETSILAEFSDYEGLRRGLSVVREQRDISLERLEEIAGAQKGYFSKILTATHSRHMGVQSLAWLIGALGVKCVIVDDPPAYARLKSRMTPRKRMSAAQKMRDEGKRNEHEFPHRVGKSDQFA